MGADGDVGRVMPSGSFQAGPTKQLRMAGLSAAVLALGRLFILCNASSHLSLQRLRPFQGLLLQPSLLQDRSGPCIGHVIRQSRFAAHSMNGEER
eukprot:362154-Chlamydomonas_euryale.AAC.4